MKLLGQDDWLFYARRDNGVLTCISIENEPAWLDTPHQGEAGHGSDAWREDNAAMNAYIALHAGDPGWFWWRECGRDTDGTPLAWPARHDEAFTAASARNYLPLPARTRA